MRYLFLFPPKAWLEVMNHSVLFVMRCGKEKIVYYGKKLLYKINYVIIIEDY
ncbi:MAG: hypothetical protein ACRDD7_04050 [Peptostreptococcaceae bacterium]